MKRHRGACPRVHRINSFGKSVLGISMEKRHVQIDEDPDRVRMNTPLPPQWATVEPVEGAERPTRRVWGCCVFEPRSQSLEEMEEAVSRSQSAQ